MTIDWGFSQPYPLLKYQKVSPQPVLLVLPNLLLVPSVEVLQVVLRAAELQPSARRPVSD